MRNYAYLTTAAPDSWSSISRSPESADRRNLDALGAVEGIALGDQYAYVTADSGLRSSTSRIRSTRSWPGAWILDLIPGPWPHSDPRCVIGCPELFTDPTLFVIDVSDPRNPQVLGSIDPPREPMM